MNKRKVNKSYEEYLQQIKTEKRQVRAVQLLMFVVFIALWEIASRQEWINPLLFSSPKQISVLLIEKVGDGSLFSHVGITLFETIFGFLFGTLFGTLLAAVLWWNPFLSKVLDPYLVILNAMPKIALGPILIVTLGPNFKSILGMGILITVIITTIVIYSAFKNVEPNYMKVIQTFGGSTFHCFKEAVLPASFPTIISTLKVNVGLAWVGVIVGEFLVSKQGLGYMIIYGFQVFNFTLVLLSLVIIAMLATIMYQLVDLLERKLIRER
ncbi:ABC transporter permease [Bacillus sp. FJAT-52991]|uniref:ABC transporter permease n=1 Tax=Bacillus kandeliae TaxID=3129297 RepID=A0ABZ2NAL7_9BACI